MPVEWLRRIWYLLNRRRFERALEQEMAAHRERMDRPPRFGNVLKLREDARDAWGWRWLDDLARDVPLSLRTLSRSPMFAVTAVAMLGLGIGFNLALFQLISGALVRPLPLKDLETLVRFDHRHETFSSNGVKAPLVRFVEQHSPVLSAVLVRHATEVAWGEQADRRIRATFVSANWFEELGATAAAGRLFGRGDALPGAGPAVVVTHDFWQRELGGRVDVVGAQVRVNDRPATVIGVASAGFPDVGLEPPSVWMPMAYVSYFVPGSGVGVDWSSRVETFARIRPGLSLDAVRTSVRATVAQLRAIAPDRVLEGEWLEPIPGTNRFLSAREAQEVWIVAFGVLALALLVLLIACLNLSNLALSRAIARVREMSIRVSLGAGRWRVVRHLLTESLVIAVLGSAGGLALALAATGIVERQAINLMALDLALDWRLAAAVLATMTMAMLAVGLVPAWKIGRADLAHATRDGGDRVSQGLQAARLRYGLIAGQVAASCLLLVFTAQLARSLQRALQPDRGFDHAASAVFDPSLQAYGFTRDGAAAYWAAVRPRIDAHPDVAETALTSFAPLNGDGGSNTRYRSAPSLRVSVSAVEPAFFSVMRIPLLAGRLFDGRDDPKTAAILARRVALEMYGTLDVIGQYFPKGTRERIIVGVVGDAHFVNPQAIDAAERYVPLTDSQTASLVVRARTDPAGLVGPLRRIGREADPRVLPDVRLMRDDYASLVNLPRWLSSIAGGVTVLALTLACIGIFGVVSHGARLRTKELGIRLALGSPHGAIVRMLLRPTMRASGLGLACGLAGAVALTPAMRGGPFFLESRDPMTYVVAALALLLASTAAAFLPAIRSLRSNPIHALRAD